MVGRRGGWRRRVDARWPSNMAPIGAKLCQNAFQTIPVKSIFGRKKFFSTKNFGVGQHFLPFRSNFGGWTRQRTSKSNSSQLFALDAHILSSVRPKNDQNMSVSVAKTLGGYGYLRVPVFRHAINGGAILIRKSSATRQWSCGFVGGAAIAGGAAASPDSHKRGKNLGSAALSGLLPRKNMKKTKCVSNERSCRS